MANQTPRRGDKDNSPAKTTDRNATEGTPDQNKHTQPQDDLYDTSDEQRGGGMGTHMTGVRKDGGSLNQKMREEEE